ncbi:DUF4129 domain-containing protein [Paenibacillus glycinis]|uniref:DUF4129 domain-containing protein n=1 Tax=Paenibacillus glycinis TaxID=2697035 RepID=A0ABW9XLQ6_9BACL|nr:DUF4129 domain-containing protein [Paenibacillus glycinis]NBD23426.1 DUF4129 domain-containing protein [Paenibacillus glycinis]
MTAMLRRLSGRLFLASLLELMLFFPVMLGAFVLKPPGSAPLVLVALLLLVAYWIGYGINALFKFRHPFPKILLALLVAAAAGIPVLGLAPGSIIATALVLCAAYRGSRLPGMPLAVRLTTQDYIVGVFLYFVGSIVQSFNDTFDEYRLLYLFAGLATLFAALYLTNRGMVSRETLSGAEKPMVEPSVRRNNRLFVGVAIGVTVLIALSYQLQALLGEAGNRLKAWLSKLFSGSGDQPPPQTQDVQPPPDFLPPDGKTKTLPAWVDYIMYGIVIAIALVLLYLILRRVNRLPGWLNGLRLRFLKLFDRDKGDLARGYVDEVERINKSERSFRKMFGRNKEERLKWKDLTDNESRIRYLYRRWIGNAVKKGFAHRPHMTPREIQRELMGNGQAREALPSAAAEALVEHYQRVRYGGGKLSDEELRAVAAQLGQPRP